MIRSTVTAADVYALRERSGMGLVECKRMLEADAVRQRLCNAETLDDLRQALLDVMELCNLPAAPK